MLAHSLIVNFKNVYHVQMDVLVVKTVMIVHNVGLIIIYIQVDFVLKYVVMEKDIHLVVMMEIIIMEMDAPMTVKFKLDSLVMEVHPILKICVQLYYQQKFHLKIEDNRDFLERL